ncbi:MazG-like protein [Paucilactobacillus kaifaensis]|uniref:MazG-like protein n=1 Tax=Paucilactobacillus kaifaensis TaxID=2559921 RepID=UPI0010FA56E8|nr:MazG-like protein [Paucilactobacillus kaifaensis]
MDINEFATRSKQIRDRYHELEIKQDGHPWNTEQDALAFLTDAGLVGRQVMNNQHSWPGNLQPKLDQKIAESIWWLCSIADQTNININDALETFLTAKEHDLK